jgi:hypothetical protein
MLKTKMLDSFQILDAKNSMIFNDTKILFLPVLCSEKTQISHSGKKNSVLVY